MVPEYAPDGECPRERWPPAVPWGSLSWRTFLCNCARRSTSRVSTMFAEETNVPRSVVFGDADRCAQAIVDRVGYDLRLAFPLSIGKPILIIDALYRLAEADR